ncbi:MAG: transglycosylase SLT domain-containing protein [Gallionellaceae bacterium]|nr:transglycosylase SLT domain-containing protein [Gallionellaceae bacterium]
MRLTHSALYVTLPLIAAGLLFTSIAQGGAQAYQPLSASVRGVLHRAVSDQAAPEPVFTTQQEADIWLHTMPRLLEKRIPDAAYRTDFIKSVYYEAQRAGLDPLMVLGLIEVESGFRKYAVSKAEARGYMQVMPFWVKQIGAREDNLFHLRTNLRYGCTILRYYLDIEKGDLYRALGRYNGSLGKPEYPNLVRTAWRKYWEAAPNTRLSLSTKSDTELIVRRTGEATALRD